ncbi:MAG TPA: MDR family MFS transporter [Symbiobacteriaceae bacterium]|nr:MDR family MFS transporter [Symbiobacteriaceae bacterium]
MFKDQRMLTVIALMMASFLTAVDVTIVDTAMPRIVGSLGGFSLLTWVITAYMLTSTATIPVYGKLADLFGRKRTFTVGALMFLAGSALCGLAQSMEQLILFRGLQGLGAGAVQPVVQTIIGDIFTPAERAKMQAWFSGVWGFSALVGPLVGGLMVDYVSWRWLFYINLPLGLIALVMLWRFLDEKIEKRKVSVDYLGSATMTGGLTLLLLAVQTGGKDYAWTSPVILGELIGAGVLLLVFLWQERRAPDPMLPLDLFKRPMISVSNLATFMVGGVMYGTSVYLPIWAQGVQGFSATRSGMSLLWLSIGWPVASWGGGRFIMRMGVRPAALLGLVLNLVGAVALTILGRTVHEIPPVAFAVVTFIIGSGMGFSSLAFMLGVQGIVDWNRRGVATATVTFMRTMGGMVWVSVMGGAMNRSLLAGLQNVAGVAARTAKEAGDVANSLLDPDSWHKLPLEQLGALREALAVALRNIHLLMVLAALLSLGVALLLPNLKFDAQAGKGSQAAGGGGD